MEFNIKLCLLQEKYILVAVPPITSSIRKTVSLGTGLLVTILHVTNPTSSLS